MTAPAHHDLVALVGPSGSGKSTLCSHLLSALSLKLSVSYTTRAPRGSEQDGVAYHFVSRASFEDLVAHDALLEWAEVHGELYGTPRALVDKAQALGQGVLFDIDHQGARQIRAKLPSLTTILVMPPTWAELEQRLRGRKTDSPEVIAKRMQNAAKELSYYAMFDYVVFNDKLADATRDVEAIVRSQRFRMRFAADAIESMLRERR
ncbi:MAG: guanylate kinase [Deltaproteobacteria bacterium]|nr:guanylate kinase [Deltaproteobacteria bacterium]